MNKFIKLIGISVLAVTFLNATDDVNVGNQNIVVLHQTHYSKNEIQDLQILQQINKNLVDVSLKMLDNKKFVRLMDLNRLFLKNPDKSRHVNLKQLIIENLLDYKTNELLLNKFLGEVNVNVDLKLDLRYKEMQTYVNNINHYLKSDLSKLANFDKVIMNYINLQKLQLDMVVNSNSNLIKNIYNKTYSNTKLQKYHKQTMLRIILDDYNKFLHQYSNLINFIYEWSGTGFKLNKDIVEVKENLEKFLGKDYTLEKIQKDLENNQDVKDELNSLIN